MPTDQPSDNPLEEYVFSMAVKFIDRLDAPQQAQLINVIQKNDFRRLVSDSPRLVRPAKESQQLKQQWQNALKDPNTP